MKVFVLFIEEKVDDLNWQMRYVEGVYKNREKAEENAEMLELSGAKVEITEHEVV